MSWILSALIWVVIGAVAGFAALKLLRLEISLAASVVVGIAATVLGGLIISWIGISAIGTVLNFIIAAAVACVVLLAMKLVRR